MQHTLKKRPQPARTLLAAALSTVVLSALGLNPSAHAQAKPPAAVGARAPQLSFDTPQAAVDALVAAVRTGTPGPITQVLGPGAGRVLRSGDPALDAHARKEFLDAHQQSAAIEADGDARASLLIGPNQWPLPFPIVRAGARWRFDTKAGLRQYLDRQIGANELAVVAVMDTYVQAQREYVLRDRNRNGLLEYAQRMVSSEGQRDGLYWPAAAGEPPSPMGARFALAHLGPDRGSDDAPQPFNGYYFRPLTGQGARAAGGAYDYIVKGRQIGGFALIATPARYGVSGLMSFIVNHDGVVFSKNLGPDTAAVAARITRFNPDTGWKREEAP
jgi:hypothetical protein